MASLSKQPPGLHIVTVWNNTPPLRQIGCDYNMPENKLYPPEGLRPPSFSRSRACGRPWSRTRCWRIGSSGVMPTQPASLPGRHPGPHSPGGGPLPWISGAQRDIAVLSRVGKPACFLVTALRADEKRRAHGTALPPGRSGAGHGLLPGAPAPRLRGHCGGDASGVLRRFLDIGCGIVAMLPIEHISVSRISHPKERFRPGQKILAPFGP